MRNIDKNADSQMKKTMIIYGNCQAQRISLCLNNIPFFNRQYEIIWERNFDHPALPTRNELSEIQLKNCAFLIEQVGLKEKPFPYKNLLSSDCRVVRFPYMKLLTLWPLLDKDPRNKPEPKYDFGRFPCGDKIVIDMIKKDIPREHIFEEYKKINLADYVDLDQLYRTDLQRIYDVDKNCDVKVYKLISEEFKTKRLFYTFSHPLPAIAKLMLLEILEKAGLIVRDWINKYPPGTEDYTVSESVMSAIDMFSKRVTSYDAIQVPIHPQVCEHFNLKWANGDTKYRNSGYGDLTFWEYMKLYIFFDLEAPIDVKRDLAPSTQLPDSRMREEEENNFRRQIREDEEKINRLLRDEKFDEASFKIKKAIEIYPNSPNFLNLEAELKINMGQLEESKKILFSVLKRWPRNVNALNNLAVLKIYEGNWEEAVKLLRKVLRIDPNCADANENLKFVQNEVLILKSKDLIKNNLFSDAKIILQGVLDNSHNHIEALNEFASILMREGHLDEAKKQLSLVLKIEADNEAAKNNLDHLKQLEVKLCQKY